MAEMRDISAVAKALMQFIDSMNDKGLSYTNITQISEICPDISDHSDVINSWRKNMVYDTTPVVIDDTADEVEGEVEETVIESNNVEVEKVKAEKPKPLTRHRMTKDIVRELSAMIADKYDGKKVDAVVAALVKNKKYDYDERAFRNLADKVTYIDITDKYFTIVDGKIHKPIQRNESVFGNDADSASAIAELLYKNNGDIMSTITDDMSADDIIRIALVRWTAYRKGHYTNIGSPTKEILMMSIIRDNKSINATGVAEMMCEKYGIQCDVSEVSAIKNGRSYKDLAKILEVVK